MVLQRDTVRACTEFAARNQLPPKIEDQMLSHVCLKFKTEGLKQQETLNRLPKALRSNISKYLFFPIVQQVHLFTGVSPNFLLQLVRPPIVVKSLVNIGNIMQIQIKQTDLYFPCVDGNGTPCFVNHQMDTMKIRLRQSEKSLGNLI